MVGKPRKAAAQQNCEAWWYESPRGIDIYVHTKETGPTVVCSIEKRQLVSYLRNIGSLPSGIERRVKP